MYNICSSKPIYIKKAVNELLKITNYKLIKNIKKNKLDVYKTYGDNTRIRKLLKMHKFTKFSIGLINTINWYKKTGIKFF